MNITNNQTNMTKVSGYSQHEIMRFTLLAITILLFIFFMIVLGIMLKVYFAKIYARQEVRYVLFAHMLVNDLMYLLSSLFLFFVSFYPVTFPVPFCYILVTVSSTNLKVTPYNLAVMSLERYVAICFSLRHGELCTVKRAAIAVTIIWAIALIPNIADFIVLCSSVNQVYFSLYITCSRSVLTVTSIQNTIRVFAHALTFSLVGLIIIFTYIKITVVAMKMDSGKASASRAGKTVMLHAFQLMLCMTAYSYTLVELLFKDYVTLLPIINFCFFMCLPRFLSPFIYGIRDELFRHHIKNVILCKN